VYIDTNVGIPRFADTLLIERLERGDDGELHPVDTKLAVVAHRDRWPASFGVALNTTALFRVRLYSGSRTQNVGGAQPTPLVSTAIDRIVELNPSSLGVEPVRVFLDGDCIGVAADMRTAMSCESGQRLHVAPTAAVRGAPMATRVGTWDALRTPDCVGQPRQESDGLRNGEVCVRGGVFALGDYRFTESPCSPSCSGGPERVVRVSSFFIDRYEVTVKRWRTALDAGLRGQLRLGPQPSTTGQVCLHLSNNPAHDNLPVNCVTWAEAAAFCAFDGGRVLPSEAQWEYAATSRGHDQLYVWGDTINARDPLATTADCDQAVFARDISGQCAPPDEPGQPRAMRVKDVGSAETDQTEQGVFDMNGNLREWMRDDIESFDTGQWSPSLGVLTDPVVVREGLGVHALRGAPWGGTDFILTLAWRDGRRADQIRGNFAGRPGEFQGSVIGFRCARPAR
jgi:formylglycine-generating enzyme required for sulfatase activity